ncbi:MAG: tetratricopeptide repeat protein [Bacteroidia bacterium]
MAKIVNPDVDIDLEEVKGDGATAVEEKGAVLEFVEKNGKMLLIGGVLLTLLVVGYLYWNGIKDGNNVKGQAAMFQAEYYFQQDSLAKALNGDGKAKGFLAVEKEFSGTKVGNLSKYYIGQIYLRQGKTAEGIKYLENFDKGNNLPSVMAYASLASANEDLGKMAEAAALFEKAAGVTSEKDDQLKPYFMVRAGLAYEDAGKKDKAAELYKQVKEKYSKSQEAQSIDKYLGRVSND